MCQAMPGGDLEQIRFLLGACFCAEQLSGVWERIRTWCGRRMTICLWSRMGCEQWFKMGTTGLSHVVPIGYVGVCLTPCLDTLDDSAFIQSAGTEVS